MSFDQGNIDDLLSEAGLGGAAEGEAAPAEGGAEAAAAPAEEAAEDSVADVLGQAAASTAAPASFASLDSELASAGGGETEKNIQNLLGDVDLRVQIVLGQAKKSVEEILALKSGDVVELEKLAGDPLDILVNERLVAKGEVLVLNENFCIRITDIIPPDDRS